MTIIDERRSYQPFEYEEAHDFFVTQQQSHWLWTEFSMNSSVDDWEHKLTEEERKIIAGVLLGFTQTELYIGSYWAQKVPVWFPKPEINLMGTTFSSFECFDKETELLTTEGWVLCKDITMEHKIAQYDLETKEIDFVHPRKLHAYKYQGVMHHYDSKCTNLMVTPNHELITIHPHTKKTTKRPSEKSKLGRNYLMPISGYGTGTSAELSVEERILIAIAADGCMRGLCPSAEGRNWRTVDFNLTKQRKVERLKSLLEAAKWDYNTSEPTEGRRGTIFRFGIPECYDLRQVKNLDFLDLETLSATKARQIIEEIILWDGSVRDKESIGFYYSTNKEAVQKIQAVAALGGVASAIGINRTAEQSIEMTMPQDNKPKSTKTCYLVSFSDRVQTTYPYRKEVEYDDYVYCVSVQKQNVVSRRGGRVSITGNSIHGKSYNYLTETLGLEDYDAFLQEPTAAAKIDNLIKCPSDSLQDKAISLAVYSGFAEGVSLYSSFAILLYFSAQGLIKEIKKEGEDAAKSKYGFQGNHLEMPKENMLKGVGEIIAYSVKDEHLHSTAGCWLFRQLLQEFPELNNGELRLKIYEAARTVVQLEFDFIDMVFDHHQLTGLDASNVKAFVERRANQKLEELGFDSIFTPDVEKARQIESWFYLMTAGESSTDFFAGRVSSYSKGKFNMDNINWDVVLAS